MILFFYTFIKNHHWIYCLKLEFWKEKWRFLEFVDVELENHLHLSFQIIQDFSLIISAGSGTRQKIMDDIVAFWMHYRLSYFISSTSIISWKYKITFVGIHRMDFGVIVFLQIFFGHVELTITGILQQELEWAWCQKLSWWS